MMQPQPPNPTLLHTMGQEGQESFLRTVQVYCLAHHPKDKDGYVNGSATQSQQGSAQGAGPTCASIL